MNNEFVPYKEALALKELGFDSTPLGYYLQTEHEYPIDKWGVCTIRPIGEFLNEEDKTFLETLFGDECKYITAPLYQQAFRWFRKEYNLWIEISKPTGWLLTIIDKERNIRTCLEDYDDYVEPTSYEEAELECLRKLIEIIK